MSIPASQIVQVNPRLLTPGGRDLEFNGLILTRSDLIPTDQMVLPFADPADVGAYFGLESEEHKLANVYFQGYDNSFTKPRALYFARRVDAAAAPFLRGGAVGSVADLKTLTDADLTLTLGGREATLEHLDFSGITTFSDAAALVEAAVRAAGEAQGGAENAPGGETGELPGGDGEQPDGGAGGASGGATGDGADADAENPSDGATATATAPASLTTSLPVGHAGGRTAREDWTGATVTYSSLFDAFVITGGAAGAGRNIAYASGAAAEALHLTLSGGAVLSQGSAALTEAENMAAVLRFTRNWVCFTSVYKPDPEAAEALARWSDAQGVAYLYVYWDDDPRLLQPNNKATVTARFAESNLSAVAAVYDSAPYAAFILGTAASIAWDRRQGAITFAFKAQDGLAADVTNAADAVNLTAQGMNFVGDYATRNDQFVFLYPGQMFGRWNWIDTYLSAVWLNNALQAAIMNGFVQTPRVPYTEAGYALVRAWIQDPVNRALLNGVIDPGVTLSESQKAGLAREAGRDISGELFTDGYVIKVADPAPVVRARRESPECSLWYTYAGSVHRLELASTAVV